MATDLLESLRSAFVGRLHCSAQDMAPYLTDWRGRWTGAALAVVQPDTPADVAAVVQWCQTQGLPVVPQGGNTGLSGGATPDTSGRAVVVSLTRLQRLRAIDPVNNTLTVDAGMTLAAVQEVARAAGRLFPLSLAAEGSCTIGGNLASNAGGVQVLRYGNARELCLGLEVVTADGHLWSGLKGLRKDNTGYDLRDLYIGSEGTLGIITGATLKLFALPSSQAVAFMAVPTPEAAIALLLRAQARAGADLTALELLSDRCLSLVEHHVPGTRFPLAERSPWYVLLELSSADDEAANQARLEDLLSGALEADEATDVVLSTSLAQRQALWALRENISEAQGAFGPTVKHDIALPVSCIAEFITTTGAQINARFPGAELVVFGHLGDGNLHYNLSPAPGTSPDALKALEPSLNTWVHDAVHARGGSISAEHGLGVLRRDEADRYKSPVERDLMQRIKAALDPRGLLNPGKLLPSTSDAALAPLPLKATP